MRLRGKKQHPLGPIVFHRLLRTVNLAHWAAAEVWWECPSVHTLAWLGSKAIWLLLPELFTQVSILAGCYRSVWGTWREEKSHSTCLIPFHLPTAIFPIPPLLHILLYSASGWLLLQYKMPPKLHSPHSWYFGENPVVFVIFQQIQEFPLWRFLIRTTYKNYILILQSVSRVACCPRRFRSFFPS